MHTIKARKDYTGKALYRYIDADRETCIEKELWWQKQGLQETATGYGARLTTRWVIPLALNSGKPRLYRVYCCCYSNVGTCYIIHKGEQIVLSGYGF